MTGPIDAYRQAAVAYTRALNTRGAGSEGVAVENDASSAGAASSSFADLVRNSLDHTIDQQRAAEVQAAGAVSGRGDLTSVVTSVAEAEVALQAVVAIRDRVIEAYKEVLRMPM